MMVGLWLGTAYLKQRGARTLSSQSPEAARSVATPRAPARFLPKQTNRYRNSYAENVLYLENYVAAEENADFRRRWLTELTKVAETEWKIDQWSIAPVAAKEQALIQDLSRLRDGILVEHEQEGINQMRTREAQFMRELEYIFKNRALVDRFIKFKRAFYTKNQPYLKPI